MKSEKKILLKDNHRRSLTSTLMIVEKLLIEIEDLMINQSIACCSEINKDIDINIINHNHSIVEESRKLICKLAQKYNTNKDIQSLQRIIDFKKTKIWEVLCDSSSKKLKGFGEFPQNLATEYDLDINELMTITNKIKY